MNEAEGQCSTDPAPSADNPLLACLGQRRRGRPPTTPAQLLAMFRTFVLIDSWRRLALRLAHRDAVPDAELEDILTRDRVPLELWHRMRAVIGRHRPYHDAPGLTERAAASIGDPGDAAGQQAARAVDAGRPQGRHGAGTAAG